MPLCYFLISRASNVFGLQILASVFIFRAVSLGSGPEGLGRLGLFATLSSVLFALPLGKMVDHLPKKTAILISHAFIFICALGVLIIDPNNMSLLLAATSILALARNFRSISQFTVFGELLGTVTERSRWINLSTLSWQIAALLSPLLAGAFGAGRAPLAVACGCLLLSLLCQFRILKGVNPATKKSDRSNGPKLLVPFLQTNFKLRSALLLDFVVVIFAGASSLLPFLHAGRDSAFDIGLLRSAMPAGVILGTVWSLHKNYSHSWANKLFYATVGYGCCHLLLSGSDYFFLSFLLLVGAGVFDALSLSVRECLLQLETPPELKGQIYAINNFLVTSSDELSEWESGTVAGWIGVRSAIRMSGAIGLVASGVFLSRAQVAHPPGLEPGTL